MRTRQRSPSPTILLRISSGGAYMHRAFNDFDQASRSGEAFAEAGFAVTMHSATGQFLLSFEARDEPAAIPPDPSGSGILNLATQ